MDAQDNKRTELQKQLLAHFEDADDTFAAACYMMLGASTRELEDVLRYIHTKTVAHANDLVKGRLYGVPTEFGRPRPEPSDEEPVPEG